MNKAVQKSAHKIASDYFGTPEWLEILRDFFFENLKDNTGWHVRLTEAIPVGLSDSDFNKIKARFLMFILEENIERVSELDISEELKSNVLAAIKSVFGCTGKSFHNW